MGEIPSEISSMAYTLKPHQNISWTATHEKSISKEYPFTDLAQESADSYVVRTYLQFLWLPESIMPLPLLVPSLLRVKVASSSQLSAMTPHPLHKLLEPLLLTARSASTKYNKELPQILSDGGGAGEIEETMMWYALNHEKGEDEDAEAPGANEKWRTKWFQRMERREFQIQILLHLLVLSLPGPVPIPAPPTPEISHVKKRKRSSKNTPAQPAEPSTAERLETFMDKLSMWQLMGNLDHEGAQRTPHSGDLDWMQLFYRDIVEPQFKSTLPAPCALLHSKIYLSSPFSDDDSQPSRTPSRSPSPDPNHRQIKRSSSITTSRLSPGPGPSRYPSPALSSNATTAPSRREPSLKPDAQSRTLARSRSRSLSVSLAQERERERTESAGANTKRRILNREVSMSRVFKGKNKSREASSGPSKLAKVDEDAASQKPPPKAKEEAITLVEATPVRKRALSRAPSRLIGGMARTTSDFGGLGMMFSKPVVEKEEIWDLPSSPDLLLLVEKDSTTSLGHELSDSESELSDVPSDFEMTPSKKSRR